MLEGEPELPLGLLNTATQAWVEEEYQRKEQSEIRESPLARYLRGPSVGRESPSSDALRRAFRTEVTRKQRRSDGTVTVEGVRFEVPSAYRTLLQLRSSPTTRPSANLSSKSGRSRGTTSHASFWRRTKSRTASASCSFFVGFRRRTTEA